MVALLCCGKVTALEPSGKKETARALAFGNLVAENTEMSGGQFIVKIFEVPQLLGECWGELESCPDVALLFTVHRPELYEDPKLYELPMSKGWEFGGWINEGRSGFLVRTALPEANIEGIARSNWQSESYKVNLSMDGVVHVE